MVVEEPGTLIENDPVHRLQEQKYLFILIVPHIEFLLDLSKGQDVGYPSLVEPHHPKYR